MLESRPGSCGWLAIALCALLAGCGAPAGNNTGNNAPSDRRPQVVSTSTILADWATRVGGDAIAQRGLLKPGVDPHIYEPVPADSIALEQADLVFYNGYNLEPGLIKLMQAVAAKARKVPVGERVPPLQMTKEGNATVPDPHVWGDVRHAIAMVQVMRDELTQLVPAERDLFARNAAATVSELEQLDAWIRQQIQTIPPARRRLITTHDAFQYFARAYGIPVGGTLIGISTEEQPSAETLRSLIADIRASGVPAIFAETTINPAVIRTVAQEAGVNLAPTPLYADSLGAPGSDGESYVKMMVANTRAIVTALGGTYTPFQPRSLAAPLP